MKNYFLLFFTFMILSCNSDDDSNSDFLVGKWIAIKNFESGVEVDLSDCAPFIIYEFNSDFSLSNFLINENQIPQNVLCGLLPWEVYEWKKIDDGKYGIYHINTPENINKTFTKNSIYLDMEFTSSEYMTRLKRYQ